MAQDVVLESLMKINRSIGQLEGKIDRAIELHETCPARLGFDALKEDTKSMKMEKKKKANEVINYVSPSMIKSLQPTLFRLLPWILLALLSGAAFTGYMFSQSGNSLDNPKRISPPIPALLSGE